MGKKGHTRDNRFATEDKIMHNHLHLNVKCFTPHFAILLTQTEISERMAGELKVI